LVEFVQLWKAESRADGTMNVTSLNCTQRLSGCDIFSTDECDITAQNRPIARGSVTAIYVLKKLIYTTSFRLREPPVAPRRASAPGRLETGTADSSQREIRRTSALGVIDGTIVGGHENLSIAARRASDSFGKMGEERPLLRLVAEDSSAPQRRCESRSSERFVFVERM
jgi:hypothetical protein